MPRIYTHQHLDTEITVMLEAKPHLHLKNVLRMSAGDRVILFNGDGMDYPGTIQTVTKKLTSIKIQQALTLKNESHLEIHILQPLCSADKMDLCIQKATELGVQTITPFISTRVNISLSSHHIQKKMTHWQSIIQSACEQSGRARLPQLNAPASFTDAIDNTPAADIKCIASPRADVQSPISEQYSPSSCICAIGPEGGFTDEEVYYAEHSGFNSIKLGPRVLRLETAVISTITYCQLHWGDFG